MKRGLQNIIAAALLAPAFLTGGGEHVHAQEIVSGASTIYLPLLLNRASPLPPPVIPGGDTTLWPQLSDITIPYGDGTQHALWFKPNKANTQPVPLIVSLHTWSTDYTTAYPQNAEVANWAVANNWAFIHPNFRGPNTGNPQAMGSDFAVQDIVDAVNYAKNNAMIDNNRIYIFGQSGGAHMALLMAGRHPEIWAGISAWASITDLMAWREPIVRFHILEYQR